MKTKFTIGDRVAVLDHDAEFDRFWPGTVTAVVLDNRDGIAHDGGYSYRVKLDAGLTWAAVERDLEWIPSPAWALADEDEYLGEDDPAAGEVTWLEACAAQRESDYSRKVDAS